MNWSEAIANEKLFANTPTRSELSVMRILRDFPMNSGKSVSVPKYLTTKYPAQATSDFDNKFQTLEANVHTIILEAKKSFILMGSILGTFTTSRNNMYSLQTERQSDLSYVTVELVDTQILLVTEVQHAQNIQHKMVEDIHGLRGNKF